MTENKINEIEPEKEIEEEFDYGKVRFDNLFYGFDFSGFESDFNEFPSLLLGIIRKYAHNKLEGIFLKREYEDALNEHSKEILERFKLSDEEEKEREEKERK